MICIFPIWHSIRHSKSSLFLAIFLNVLNANQKLLMRLYNIDIRCHALGNFTDRIDDREWQFLWKIVIFTLFFALKPCFHGNNSFYPFELDFIEFLMLFNIGNDILFSPLSQIEADILWFPCPLYNWLWSAYFGIDIQYIFWYLLYF